MLRYTLYETDAERVPLARELEFTDDYLALERLRHPTVPITHTVSGVADPLRIAPLLLHPLLEQLFVGLVNAGPVSIVSTWQLADNTLTLRLARSSATPLPPYATTTAVRAAERRLQLQYLGHHDLDIAESPTHLQVSLRLEL